MKHIITIAALLCTMPLLGQSSKIYIVRHAEKNVQSTDKRNPDLSEQGQKRALKLLKKLRKKNIKTIYSTGFKRTQQTAQPLANAIKTNIIQYEPSNPKELIQNLKGSTTPTLIVGHSNTIIPLINELGCTLGITTIKEDEYDYLFQILLKDSKCKVITTKY